ncbi:MAG: OsmC family protein [Arenicellales bacterium]|jgi:putative redox protein|nr:OsmC family protein [Arenicellales bacterium]
MHATITLSEDDSLYGHTDSGHGIVMDRAPDVGGRNRGARPMEMLLLGLGGCTLIDVMLILRKARQPCTDVRIELEAERATEVPRVFTKIHVHFALSGAELDPQKVARAIRLSAEKYCSASQMLGAVAEITHDFEILPG